MTYKALNTFIDDLFAFIIKMPTLYRLGKISKIQTPLPIGQPIKILQSVFRNITRRFNILYLSLPEMDISD